MSVEKSSQKNTTGNVKKREKRFMDVANGSGIWKLATAVLSGIVVTGIGIWLLLGQTAATRSDLRTAIKDHEAVIQSNILSRADVKELIYEAFDAKINYPYLQDKQLIMNHLKEGGAGSRHETDTDKRKRIREELDVFRQPIETRLKAIENSLDEIKRKLNNK